MIRDLTEALAVVVTFIGIFMLAWALAGTDEPDEPEPISYVIFDPINEEYPQCPVGNIVVYDLDGTWFCDEDDQYWAGGNVDSCDQECPAGKVIVETEEWYTCECLDDLEWCEYADNYELPICQ